MDYAQFCSDIRPDRAMHFTSADENQEVMEQFEVNQQVQQLGAGKFEAHLVNADAGNAAFFADRFSKAVTMYLEPPTGNVGILVCRSANRPFLCNGEDVANDKLVFVAEGAGADLVGPDLCGSEALGITRQRFTAIMHAVCPSAPRLTGVVPVDGDTARLHALRNEFLGLLNEPEHAQIDERASRVVAETLAWLGESTSGWRPERVRMQATRAQIARRARDFIHDHYADTLRLEELCDSAGAGVRTLQRCFRAYFGLTYTQYLSTIRLNAAHRDLEQSKPDSASVADIAMRHGFTHLGRFSVGFRRRFGVSPRVLLSA